MSIGPRQIPRKGESYKPQFSVKKFYIQDLVKLQENPEPESVRGVDGKRLNKSQSGCREKRSWMRSGFVNVPVRLLKGVENDY